MNLDLSGVSAEPVVVKAWAYWEFPDVENYEYVDSHLEKFVWDWVYARVKVSEDISNHNATWEGGKFHPVTIEFFKWDETLMSVYDYVKASYSSSRGKVVNQWEIWKPILAMLDDTIDRYRSGYYDV